MVLSAWPRDSNHLYHVFTCDIEELEALPSECKPRDVTVRILIYVFFSFQARSCPSHVLDSRMYVHVTLRCIKTKILEFHGFELRHVFIYDSMAEFATINNQAGNSKITITKTKVPSVKERLISKLPHLTYKQLCSLAKKRRGMNHHIPTGNKKYQATRQRAAGNTFTLQPQGTVMEQARWPPRLRDGQDEASIKSCVDLIYFVLTYKEIA